MSNAEYLWMQEQVDEAQSALIEERREVRRAVRRAVDAEAEVERLRELLAQSKGSIRLLAEELEGGVATKADVAAPLDAA